MTSVAIIGINSVVAPDLLKALTGDVFAGKFQYPIKALTRSTEGKTNTDKVQYVAADYNDADLVVKTLSEVDVIISLVTVDPTLLKRIEPLVIAAKPKLYIPSQFGVEVKTVRTYIPGLVDMKDDHSENVRAAGIKVVDFYTGFFASPKSWAYEIVAHFGIDAQKKEYTVRGDYDTPITVTNLKDLGLAISAVASQPAKDWPEQLRVESDKATFRDVVERYEKDHNVKLTKAGEFTKEETLATMLEKLKTFTMADFIFFLHTVASQGRDRGVSFTRNDDELVNPGQKLWQWSKY